MHELHSGRSRGLISYHDRLHRSPLPWLQATVVPWHLVACVVLPDISSRFFGIFCVLLVWLTALMLSRVAAPPSSGATRSFAPTERRKPRAKRTPLRRLLQRVRQRFARRAEPTKHDRETTLEAASQKK
jgi:hypothetical protein